MGFRLIPFSNFNAALHFTDLYNSQWMNLQIVNSPIVWSLPLDICIVTKSIRNAYPSPAIARSEVNQLPCNWHNKLGTNKPARYFIFEVGSSCGRMRRKSRNCESQGTTIERQRQRVHSELIFPLSLFDPFPSSHVSAR